MTLAAGSRLGPYEILSPLGAGGMGEVYRARDPRLGRDVAIKIVLAAFTADGERVRRFEQEARAAAALNHPNILAVYDIGQHEGQPYVVSELLEGQTLREALAGGTFAVKKTLDYAIQICQGLGAAHEKGIVHRDVKPENLFITKESRVKILDFGVAKLVETAAAGVGATIVATRAMETTPGLVIGTIGYMSPEQVRGQTVDHRSDIFSFGTVVYEMLSGARAFEGATPADTMSAILKTDPVDVVRTPADLPPFLNRVVRRCLEKDPSERFQSARDLVFDLQSVSLGTADAAGAPRVTKSNASGLPRLRHIGFLVAGLMIGALGGWYLRADLAKLRAPVAAPLFSQVTDQPGVKRSPSLSPDGKTIAYVGDMAGHDDIYVLRVGGQNPVNLTADASAANSAPAFSPDGERIAFRSERQGGGVFVMGASGESVRRVTDFGFDPSWSPDGRQIVVSTVTFTNPLERYGNGRLFVVDATTGDRREIATPGDAVQPNWSPHGHRIAYWGVDRSATGRRDLWTVPADGSGPSLKVLDDEPADWNPVWSGDGQYLYFVSDRGGVPNTWRVALNEQTGRALGEPEPLAIPAQWINGISVARDGRLAFAASDRRSTLARLAFDSAGEKVVGNAVVVLQAARRIGWDDWSPDGTWLTFTIAGTADNLYVMRADGTGYRQLTNDTRRNRGPRWTRDGLQIVFYSNRAGAYQLWTINVDGSGLRQLTNLAGGLQSPLLSPDGLGVVFNKAQPAVVLAFVDLRHTDRETIWPVPPGMTAAPLASSWSKDGSRLAGFTSSPENRMFVYTPKLGTYRDLGHRGADPHWLSDDRRLLFHDENRLMILDTESGRTQELFRTAPRTTIPTWSFSLSRDERQVALVLTEEQSDIWMINPNRSDRTP